MKTTKCGFYRFNPLRSTASLLLCSTMLSTTAGAIPRSDEISKRTLVDVGPQ